MKGVKFLGLIAAFVVLCGVVLGPVDCFAAKYKVLVVFSYEEDYGWDVQTRQGIESVLKDVAEIKYFYMNTKKDPNNAQAKADEAYAVYQQYQPDGVIVSDDIAQSTFVVKYLSDKVSTPVMFAGVNSVASKYGYPSKNVSGMQEVEPIKESLSFVSQLVPGSKTFGFISKDDVTGTAIVAQIEKEAATYPLSYVGAKLSKTVADALVDAEFFKGKADILLYITMEGITDKDGKPTTDQDIMPQVIAKFGKPVITNNQYRVELGALCSVVKDGAEQGAYAAESLLKVMKGAPVASIPIVPNQFGTKILNIEVLNATGLKVDPSLTSGVTMVKTKK